MEPYLIFAEKINENMIKITHKNEDLEKINEILKEKDEIIGGKELKKNIDKNIEKNTNKRKISSTNIMNNDLDMKKKKYNANDNTKDYCILSCINSSNEWKEEYLNDYPIDWKSCNYKIGDIKMNARFLTSLLPGQEVLDDIIDAFIIISKYEQNSFDPLIFPVATFLCIQQNKTGIYNYAYKNNASTKKIWIIPKGGNNHWILLVIIFNIKAIINLDSLHGSLNINDLTELCSFIDTIYYALNLENINWSEWTFYTPKDIPHQLRGKSQGNNCGIHLCLYVHIICTSTYIIFDKNVMDIIKKYIIIKYIIIKYIIQKIKI